MRKPRLPAFLAAFEVRNFRLIWTGAFVSSIGTWIQDVALSWVIHTEFKNPSYLGWRQFASELPLVSFMLLGGVLADRINKKTILMTSQFVQLSLALVLAALYFTGHLSIWAIVAVGFITGLAQSQSAPTYQAFLTSIVPREVIPRAVAMNSLQFNLSRSIGPPIAAAMLVALGAAWCFVFNAFSFVAVVVALLLIRIPAAAPNIRAPQGMANSLKEGLAYVRQAPEIALIVGLSGALSFFVFPLTTFLPVVADEVLGSGAGGYSMLLSAIGLGAIVGAIATAHRGGFKGRGRFVLICFTGGPLLGAGAVLCGRQWLATVLLFFYGVVQTSGSSTMNGLVQELAPEAMRGRILSLFGFAFRGGSPIGALLLGYSVTAFGPAAALSASLIGMSVLSATLLYRSPRFREI
ncbi:MAG: MFS transporter [Vicinamibacteria bacterium]|nr:MFS transporter [Vicinamibacteria bacterium]